MAYKYRLFTDYKQKLSDRSNSYKYYLYNYKVLSLIQPVTLTVC
ncbi:hypothetical protein PL9214291367 [Planktothrix tepida PCC 9214]|uniref:Uncharacterized protein n=1 Tax=Planktothrix tepida PCC 9214 TaxID=671072 RepID=A0A1J1LHU0_9CYAN|nr:hypothetical protein PL9214291367 [Planktothrix tepida PCC 9214]